MDAPEKIWAWEIDHEIIPPNGFYAVCEVDESTEYTRTDRANELVAAAYEAAARVVSRAGHSLDAEIRSLTPAEPRSRPHCRRGRSQDRQSCTPACVGEDQAEPGAEGENV